MYDLGENVQDYFWHDDVIKGVICNKPVIKIISEWKITQYLWEYGKHKNIDLPSVKLAIWFWYYCIWTISLYIDRHPSKNQWVAIDVFD